MKMPLAPTMCSINLSKFVSRPPSIAARSPIATKRLPSPVPTSRRTGKSAFWRCCCALQRAGRARFGEHRQSLAVSMPATHVFTSDMSTHEYRYGIRVCKGRNECPCFTPVPTFEPRQHTRSVSAAGQNTTATERQNLAELYGPASQTPQPLPSGSPSFPISQILSLFEQRRFIIKKKTRSQAWMHGEPTHKTL